MLDEILPEWFMLVGRRFQTERYVLKSLLFPDRIRVEAESFESFPRRIKDELSQKGSSPCRAEEGVMAVLRHIDADQ